MIKTIAEQDATLPPCPRGKCSVCDGNPLQHHWMLDFYENEDDENDPRNGDPFLICRHCPAKIMEFDSEDPDCPEV